VTGRRPLPPALRDQLAPRFVLAATGIAVAAIAVVLTLLAAGDARAFERRGVTTMATVTTPDARTRPPTASQVVAVQFTADGAAVKAFAPTLDRGRYRPGDRVAVRYDPARPQQVRFVDEPYDAATPLAVASGLALVAAVGFGASWWRARRVCALAASDEPQWSFQGALEPDLRPVLPDRWWLRLHPLDRPDAPPVASVRVLDGGALHLPERFPVLVRGDVRHGGTVVARAGSGQVLWPAGRVRVDR
jgi:hypothetical protein